MRAPQPTPEVVQTHHRGEEGHGLKRSKRKEGVHTYRLREGVCEGRVIEVESPTKGPLGWTLLRGLVLRRDKDYKSECF